jgi:RNA polymerase sigma-70 factor, ECF subfamily
LGEPFADAELVESALGGNQASFVALCERHRARIWRIAASVALEADAEDLAQEVVIRAYRSLRSYQRQASFGAWICRIAVNAAYDYQRSAWKRKVTLVEQPEREGSAGAAEGEYERQEVQRRVRGAVATLPEPQRAPIWLHYFEGYAVAEVARLEGMPEATVRSRMRSGMKRLSAMLQDLMPEPELTRALEPDARGCGA